jgi:hypothetical protein
MTKQLGKIWFIYTLSIKINKNRFIDQVATHNFLNELFRSSLKSTIRLEIDNFGHIFFASRSEWNSEMAVAVGVWKSTQSCFARAL